MTEAVDLVVHCDRIDDRPVVTEIIAVEEQRTDNAGAFTTTTLFRRDADGRLAATGEQPVRLASRLARHGHDIRRLLDDYARGDTDVTGSDSQHEGTP